MYCENLGFSIPGEIILEIKFLEYKDFRPLMFNDKEYIVVAEDDVGNFVGVNPAGKVYFLDTEENTEIYASKDFQTFVKQLELYRDSNFLPVNASDEQLEADARQFAREIASLDKDALLYEENFWSLIIEQMEDGLL